MARSAERCYRRGGSWPGSPGNLDEPHIRRLDRTRDFDTVANIKSQKKRNVTNAKRAARNKATKSELKTRVKTAVRLAESTEDTDESAEAVRLAVKKIDKAAAKGVIHPNQAARRKSRLMAKVNAAG